MTKQQRPYSAPVRQKRGRIAPQLIVDYPEQRQQVPANRLPSKDYSEDKPEKAKTDWGKWGVIAAVAIGGPVLIFAAGEAWNQVKNDIGILQGDDTQSKKDIGEVKEDLTKIHGQVDHLGRLVITQQAANVHPQSDAKTKEDKKP